MRKLVFLLLLIVVVTPGLVRAAAAAAASGGIYWTDADVGVYHAGLDGTGAQRVVLSPSRPLYIEVDPTVGRMFWAADTAVLSANLDGSDLRVIADGLSRATGLTLDRVHERVYWTEYFSSRVMGANYDLSDRALVSYIGGARGVAVDAPRNRLIVADGAADVWAIALSDQSITLITAGPGYTGQDVAVDQSSGMIFWADGPVGAGRIWRANADGSDPEVIATLAGTPTGLDFVSSRVYWANAGTATVERADPDGSARETLFTRPEAIWGVALPPSYAFPGVDQPVNRDGSSVFKAGSTVPITFELLAPDGSPAAGVVATLRYAFVSGAVEGPINEAVSTASATAGNTFRSGMSGNRYVFNWSTASLAPGTYHLHIGLDDGSDHLVTLSLK